jgi:hypothetical protein
MAIVMQLDETYGGQVDLPNLTEDTINVLVTGVSAMIFRENPSNPLFIQLRILWNTLVGWYLRVAKESSHKQ